MNELVPQSNIHNYAVRNTSSKMPIEQKYVEAFISAIFSSPELKEVYKRLQNIMWNEDSSMVFLSLWDNLGIINEEPYRSIVAYAMLKKDEKLFEMISSALFTGTFEVQWDQNFVKKIVHYTDENMAEGGQEEDLPHTDIDLYTDMVEGIPFLVFHNLYCDNIPNDPNITSRYQTSTELLNNIDKFKIIMTVCKPARAEVIFLYEPWIYVSMVNPSINAGTEIVLFDGADATTSTALNNYMKSKTNTQLLTYYNSIEGRDNSRLIRNESYPDDNYIRCMVEFNGKIYASDQNHLRRTNDNDEFEFVGDLPGRIYSMAATSDRLYISAYDDRILYNTNLYYVDKVDDSVKTYSLVPYNCAVYSYCDYNGSLYAGTNKGLYVSKDRYNFVLNKESFTEYVIKTMIEFNGDLYLGTDKGVFVSTNGVNFQEVDDCSEAIVTASIIFNDKLYFATENKGIYKWIDGYRFFQVFYNPNSYGYSSMAVFNNELYIGGSGLYKLNILDEFSYVYGSRGAINCLAVFDNYLYLGTAGTGYGDLYRTSDGVSFSQGLLPVAQDSILTLCVYNDTLYLSRPWSNYMTKNGVDFGYCDMDDKIFDSHYKHRVMCFYKSGDDLFAGIYNFSDVTEGTSVYKLTGSGTYTSTFQENLPVPMKANGQIFSLGVFNDELYISLQDRRGYYQHFYRTSNGVDFTVLSQLSSPYTTADRFFVINNRLFISQLTPVLVYSDDGINFQSSSGFYYSDGVYAMCEFNGNIYASTYRDGIRVSTDNGETFPNKLDVFNSDYYGYYSYSIAKYNQTLYASVRRYSNSSFEIRISYDGNSWFYQKDVNPTQLKELYPFESLNRLYATPYYKPGLYFCTTHQKPQDQFIITHKTIEDFDVYRMMTIEIMTSKSSFIWGNITLKSNDTSSPTHLPDITIVPDNVISEQKTSSKYFITVQLRFPVYRG